MSDGQPKKRKEKRKKKDDIQEEVFGNINDIADEVIHVQKDSGVGGNVCTKLVFFVILAALGLILGLSFLKYNDPSDRNAEAVEPSPLAVSIEELLFQIPFVEDVLTGEIFKDNRSPESSPNDDDHEDDGGGGSEVSEKEDESSLLSWVTFGLLDSSPSADDAKAEDEHDEEHEDEHDEEHEDDEHGEEDEDDEVDEGHEEEEEEEGTEEENEDDHDETEGSEEEGNEEEENEEPASPELLDEEDGEGSPEEGELETSKEEEEKSVEEEEEEGETEEENEGDEGEEEEEREEEEEDQGSVGEEEEETEDGDEGDGEGNLEDEGSVEQMEETESLKGGDKSEENQEDELDLDEEELFPEAAEALRLEREAREQSKLKNKPAAPVEEPEEKSNSVFEEWTEEEPEETKTDGIALKFGVGVCLVVVAHIVLVKKWNSWVAHTQPTTEKVEAREPEIVPVTSAPAPPTSSPPPPPEEPKSQYISPSTVQDIIDRFGVEEDYSEGEEEEEEEDNLIEEPISNSRYQNLMSDYYKGDDEGSDLESDPEIPDKYTGRKEEESENEVETGSEVENSEGEEEEEEEEDEEPVAVQRSQWASSVKKEEPLTESEDDEEEEEEESDDEPPVVAKPKLPTGGARSVPEEDYPYSEITNEEDWYIREQLDRAEEEFQFRGLYF